MSKTHYNKVYKSDYLGVCDLEEMAEEGKTPFVFTILRVEQKRNISIAGKAPGDYNIAFFKEKIKPWVINSTNAKLLRKFAKSEFIEDWTNIPVELYIAKNIKGVGGEIVDGVRIRPTQPVLTKPTLTPTHPSYKSVVAKLQDKTTTLETVKEHFNITPAVEKTLLELCQKTDS